MKISGTADIIAEALLEKLKSFLGLLGDGINEFIEALRRRKDKTKFILVKHEKSAGVMAFAYAKNRGKLGVCLS